MTSSRSSWSFLTVKRVQATLNLKSAQLQAKHARERAEEQQPRSRLETKLQQREALRKVALAKLDCKLWEEAERYEFWGLCANPNPSTLLTPSSLGTQFLTSSTANKRVTFGQTAISSANTSRSGYEANWGAAPLNESASRPPLDARQYLSTQSYSPFTNAPYQPWLYNVDYDSMFLPRPEFPKFKENPLEFKSFLNGMGRTLEQMHKSKYFYFCELRGLEQCINRHL